MRLTELLGVRKYANDDFHSLISKYLVGGGKYHLIGAGSHGVVLDCGEYVTKVWARDNAYTDYVEYCLAHQNNPWLPKFKSVIKTLPTFFIHHREFPDRLNYIKMEKLVPAHAYGTDLFRVFKGIQDPHVRSFTGFKNAVGPELSAEYEKLMRTLLDIKDLGYTLDLTNHMGNVMLRSDQIVLIDPIYSKHDLDINDLFIEPVYLGHAPNRQVKR